MFSYIGKLGNIKYKNSGELVNTSETPSLFLIADPEFASQTDSETKSYKPVGKQHPLFTRSLGTSQVTLFCLLTEEIFGRFFACLSRLDLLSRSKCSLRPFHFHFDLVQPIQFYQF